jgi:hypothetical protein
VREAILQHLEDLEDLYLAEDRLERIRSDDEPTIPLEEVMKRHGLKVEFSVQAGRELKKLDPQQSRRILKFLDERVGETGQPASHRASAARPTARRILEIPSRGVPADLQD